MRQKKNPFKETKFFLQSILIIPSSLCLLSLLSLAHFLYPCVSVFVGFWVSHDINKKYSWLFFSALNSQETLNLCVLRWFWTKLVRYNYMRGYKEEVQESTQ